jgi:CRP/FNR family transcriptional regulator, cyclic AMP receptor protein
VRHLKAPPDSVCHVLREDPELAQAVSPGRRARAQETCTARALSVTRGRWREPARHVPDGAGLLVLEGLLLRRVSVEGRSGAELLGTADLIRPWQDDSEPSLRRTTAWRALQLTRLAVLDDSALDCMSHYPEIIHRLLERSLERSRRLAVNMAIVHHPRIDIRLQMLFWHLADRWGHVRDGRMFLPLRLTHSVLADLIVAQRPTVSTALSGLASRRIVRRVPDGWLLLAPPPTDGLASDEPTAPTPAEGSPPAARKVGRPLDHTRRRTRSPRVSQAGQDASAPPG